MATVQEETVQPIKPKVTRAGRPDMNTNGPLPAVGQVAPDFRLAKTLWESDDISKKDFAEKVVVMNFHPDLLTPTCTETICKFNTAFKEVPEGVVLLNICKSTPPAFPFFPQQEKVQKRGVPTEQNLNPDPKDKYEPSAREMFVSCFRDDKTQKDYGVYLENGIRGACARAVVAFDQQGVVIYSELVTELTNQPNYEAVMAKVKEVLARKNVSAKENKGAADTGAKTDAEKPKASKADAAASAAGPAIIPQKAMHDASQGQQGGGKGQMAQEGAGAAPGATSVRAAQPKKP